MTGVTLRPNESQESLLRRFRKKVTRAGILSTVRRKRWFVSKSELRQSRRRKPSAGSSGASASMRWASSVWLRPGAPPCPDLEEA